MLLAGKHVLLVEDQLLIALEAEDNLMALGAAKVTVTSTVEEALAAMAGAMPDFAILDINLGAAGTSFPAAEALAAHGVPFAFATGYGEGFEVPASLRPSAIIRKPYDGAILAQAAKKALSTRA